MNITAAAVGFQHSIVPAVESTDAQFDLREVHREEPASGRGAEQSADADGVAALARHILQIGIPHGKAARFRPQRQIVRVDAAGDAA